MNVVIKQKFGVFLSSRDWWKQFRELVTKRIDHNVETGLTGFGTYNRTIV